YGVYLGLGGSVTNGQSGSSSGLISGATYGVKFEHAGTVANFGTITGSNNSGVYLRAGGSVTNGQSGSPAGLISGQSDGVQIDSGAGTVTNFGTIAGAGGTAVGFGGTGGNRVVIEPGAVFSGIVNGGTGDNTLELGSAASVGTLVGLGTKYLGFSNVTVDAGARWALSGNTIGAGVKLRSTGSALIARALAPCRNLLFGGGLPPSAKDPPPGQVCDTCRADPFRPRITARSTAAGPGGLAAALRADIWRAREAGRRPPPDRSTPSCRP
ncbi:MAG: hypothetical protein WA459_11135, partial [Stellaceae bacterium]